MDPTIIASIIGALAAVAAAVLPHYLAQRRKLNSKPVVELENSNNLISRPIKTIKTWAGQSEFSYCGSVKEGTQIIIGESRQVSEVTADQYRDLIRNFSGKKVKVGATQSSSYEPGTLDAWLKKNVTKRMIATYVASILKHESYATNTQGKIEFN
jgi:hypothetical protein